MHSAVELALPLHGKEIRLLYLSLSVNEMEHFVLIFMIPMQFVSDSPYTEASCRGGCGASIVVFNQN